jgi:Tfp pilus assembly protein PilF
MTVGEASGAERALGDSSTPAAMALRARCRLALGDLDGAAAIAERALAQDASDIRSLDVMAVIAARRGDSMKALEFLHRALDVDPFDGEAGQLLARWEDHGNSQ